MAEAEETGRVTRLTKQPSLITGTTLREYQLEGLNWMISLHDRGISGACPSVGPPAACGACLWRMPGACVLSSPCWMHACSWTDRRHTQLAACV